MNKLLFTFIVLFFLNNCSFNENSSLWSEKNQNLEIKNTKNISDDIAEVKKELNENLKLDLAGIKIKNKIDINKNNYSSQKFGGQFNKISNYKFSKWDKKNNFNFKPVFLKDGIIFFDKKGSIIKYDSNQKVLWKKNYYSKAEKKLNPKMHFYSNNENLFIFDNIAKYYSLNLKSGELNWSKNNIYPFNSEVKIYKDKIFVVDYENTLRCYKIKDGSEVWSLKTDKSFTISQSKHSLIIVDNSVVFSNSIGDITSVNIDTGLIQWQVPTQNTKVKNESYNLKFSKLISDGDSIFFSTNKNEFYSIEAKTGTINWINKINSNVMPVIIGNLIITISNEGYFYLLERKNGKIIRATNLFESFKEKQKEQIYPIGFVVGDKNLYLTNSDGDMMIISLETGRIMKVIDVARSIVSEPFIFNNNLYVVRNGSIVQYN